MPNQPIKISLAGVDLNFSRDLDSELNGYIVVQSSMGSEKLNLTQFQSLVSALGGLRDLTTNVVRNAAIKV